MTKEQLILALLKLRAPISGFQLCPGWRYLEFTLEGHRFRMRSSAGRVALEEIQGTSVEENLRTHALEQRIQEAI